MKVKAVKLDFDDYLKPAKRRGAEAGSIEGSVSRHVALAGEET